MTESLVFTAASVMQRLWLADAALAVRRRTQPNRFSACCLSLFSPAEANACPSTTLLLQLDPAEGGLVHEE